MLFFFFFQAEDGIRDGRVTGVQTCALPIFRMKSQGTDPRTILAASGRGHMRRSPCATALCSLAVGFCNGCCRKETVAKKGAMKRSRGLVSVKPGDYARCGLSRNTPSLTV